MVLAETLELAAQGGQRLLGDAQFLGQALDAAVITIDMFVVQEFAQPHFLQFAVHGVHGGDLWLGQVHDPGQHLDILRLDVFITDLNREIGVRTAPPTAFVVQRGDDHLAGEDLFQALDAVRVFGGPFPAILVVHIEDQIGGHTVFDHACQQRAAEECLTGARFAEHRG